MAFSHSIDAVEIVDDTLLLKEPDSEVPELLRFSLDSEHWREYDFDGRVYHISNPVALYLRPGGSTHRVLDSDGIVHCIPAPGECGCVLRWYSKSDAVSF